LSLTPEERTWLQTACPFFEPAYLDYLAAFRFEPSQVRTSFVPRAPSSDEGRIEFEASGPWAEAILWEVPLMATLSEIYFNTVDRDWNLRMRRAQGWSRQAARSANSGRVAGVRITFKTL